MNGTPKTPGQGTSLIKNASAGAECRAQSRTSHSRRRRDRHMSSAGPLAWIEQLEPRSMMSVNPVGAPAAPLLPAESIDGIGNNVAHPTWGSTGQDLLRLSPAAYGDGIATASGAAPVGDLLVTLRVTLPEKIDPDFEALMRKWVSQSPYDPRKDMA